MRIVLSRLLGFALLGAFLHNSVLAQQYVIYTVAGGAPVPTPAPAATASISLNGLAFDGSGNAYFCGYHAVYKIDTAGVLTRVAGTARPGFSGDGGPAVNAQLDSPQSVAVDNGGNVYIADLSNNRIRKVSPNGIIQTIAGSAAIVGFSGDGGPAISAGMEGPISVTVDNTGNLYILDGGNLRIRMVTLDGLIHTIAGNGLTGYFGDGGSAIQASLGPQLGQICADGAGNVYLSTVGTNSYRVRKISTDGTITTVAGTGTSGTTGVGGPAAAAELEHPYGIAVDHAGNLFIGDTVRVLEVSPNGMLTSVLGNGGAVPASTVAVDGEGNLFVVEGAGTNLERISANGTLTSVAGDGAAAYSGDGGPATLAQMNLPLAVALDSAGTLYIADYVNKRVRKISSDGVITTVAGGGAPNGSLFNAPATSIALGRVSGLAVDAAGEIFVSDSDNSCVWKVGADGIIVRYAGNGNRGFSGDGGLAVNAALNTPWGLALDAAGNLYIADEIGNRVRKVTPGGIISTLAGNGSAAYSGDGGPGSSASLNFPQSVAADTAGNVYITDRNNSRVRMVSPSGIITTAPGGASVAFPSGIVADASGNLFVSDGAHIFKLTNGSPIVIAGYFVDVYAGDGGPANSAGMGPLGLALGSGGAIYEADQFHSVRVILPVAPLSFGNGASGVSGAVAPGEIITLYGSGLGPAQLVPAVPGSDGLYDSQLAGTAVTVNGIPAPILYTAAFQVAAIVPYEVSGAAEIAVTYLGQAAADFFVPVVAAQPGLFTQNSSGTGQAAALNQDQSINSASNPAARGNVISLFETGEGQTSPGGVDGMPAAASLPEPVLPVTATIGGLPAQVQYAGAAPGEVAGLMQINVQIPGGAPTGNAVPIVLKVGGIFSQAGVTIAVR